MFKPRSVFQIDVNDRNKTREQIIEEDIIYCKKEEEIAKLYWIYQDIEKVSTMTGIQDDDIARVLFSIGYINNHDGRKITNCSRSSTTVNKGESLKIKFQKEQEEEEKTIKMLKPLQ